MGNKHAIIIQAGSNKMQKERYACSDMGVLAREQFPVLGNGGWGYLKGI